MRLSSTCLRTLRKTSITKNRTALVDERFLDSFDILAIINAIDDEFDIAVPAKEVVPANFNSAQGISTRWCCAWRKRSSGLYLQELP